MIDDQTFYNQYYQVQNIHRFLYSLPSSSHLSSEQSESLFRSLESLKQYFSSKNLTLLVNQCDSLLGRVRTLEDTEPHGPKASSLLSEIQAPSKQKEESPPVQQKSPQAVRRSSSLKIEVEGESPSVLSSLNHPLTLSPKLLLSRSLSLISPINYSSIVFQTRCAVSSLLQGSVRRISRIFFRIFSPKKLSIRTDDPAIDSCIKTLSQHSPSKSLLQNVNKLYSGIGGVEVKVQKTVSTASWRTPFQVRNGEKTLARPAMISISPDILQDPAKLTDSLIFELINASKEDLFSALALKAVRGEVTRDEFIKESELVEFQTLKEQRSLSYALLKRGVPVKEISCPFRDEEQFWSYIKGSTHADSHGLRYDQILRWNHYESLEAS